MATADAGRMETSDVEEHFDGISPWQVRFDQMSRGLLHRSFEYVRTPGLMFFRDRWNQRIRVTGSSPPGYVQIGVPAPDNLGIVFHGEEINSRRLSVKSPDEEVEFSTARTSHHDCLLVAPDLLHRHLGDELTNTLMTHRHTMECDPLFSSRLFCTIERLTTQYQRHPGWLECEGATESIESEVLDVLRQGITFAPERFTRAALPKRKKALRRAVEFATELKQTIPVPELSRIAGVNQRTLQHAFEETFGVSPVTYLKWQRMNHLRRELRAAEPRSTSVTHCSLEWGFGELGRLAGEYYELFGEFPSTTLARTACQTPEQVETMATAFPN